MPVAHAFERDYKRYNDTLGGARGEKNEQKMAALVVLVVIASLSIAGCPDNRIKETQTTAQPSSVATTAPPAGQAQVSVNAQYRGAYIPSQYFPTPKPGNQYVQFYVTVKNLNADGVLLGNAFSFTLFDSANQGYSPATVTFMNNDYIKSVQNSHPGDTTAGTLVFEIKQGATPQKLIYSDFSNKVTVPF